MKQRLKSVEHPWDDNLPANKEYIKKFYKKSEKEIKNQEGEGRKTDNA